ncbi:MAG: glycosyltransferase, partial [Candidatus Bathyarchaeia archaeon]
MSISVIVPMRNEGENVRPLADEIYEFIRSNNLMTFAEVIFVDDGSEDATLSIIKKYIPKMTMQVKVFHHEWMGLGPSR